MTDVTSDKDRESEFLSKLTDLCREYGLGISANMDEDGERYMFVYDMQTGSDTDYDRKFTVDENGVLEFV